MSAPWLIAVCAGRWQLHGIQSAQRAGIKVFAIDGDPSAPGLKIADHAAVADVRNPEAVVTVVKNSGIRPSGALSIVSEAGMMSVALLREQFDLPGPNIDLSTILTNKARQRELWQRADVPGPRWRLAHTREQIGVALREIGLPAIIKPVDSAGSRGVTKITEMDPWETAADLALSNSHSKSALVESYMQGTEYTIETFGDRGRIHVLAVTEKAKVPGTGGTVAMELATPGSAEKARCVAEAATVALTAIGYTEGAGHTEVILQDNGQPGLVETAGRGGGFMVFDGLIPSASGFDIATACALQAVGLPVPPVPGERRAVVLRFFPSRPGRVVDIQGFEAANQTPGVQAEPFVTVGHSAGAARADGDRLGYILTTSSTPGEAQALANQAERKIRFIMDHDAQTAHS